MNSVLKSEVFVAVLLCTLCSPLLVTSFGEAIPSLPVHNDDTGLNYATLQEALDANESTDGHTIRVDAGIYYEHVLVNKSISLVGEDSETTIIDGGGVGTVVKVTADNVTLSRFTIRNGGGELSDNAVLLHSVRDCRISGNKFADSRTGIWIVDSYGCNITENYAENNFRGINPHNSGSIKLFDNIARNNTHGIFVENAPDCVLRNNTMTANKYNFRVESGSLIDVDTSNTVDGKLVYYFANQQDLTITQQTCPNAGYLAVINSTGVTIRDLSVENEGQGILLQSTNRSSIQNVTIASSYFGIYLGNSQYNSIIENRLKDNEIAIRTESNSNFNSIARNEITNNFRGVFLGSYANNVTENKIDHNQYGIYLTSIASRNNIIGNNVTQNEHAIYFFASSENLVFHNNFLNNQGQVGIWGEGATYHNLWNGTYPIGGNYWSDYNGNDTHTGELQNLFGSDGIGDTPYVIDRLNSDNFPLMHIYSPLFCDLNDDRKVDMKDVALAATSFGSSIDQTKWNQTVDVNGDGSVDIKDLVQIAKNFGNNS